MGSGCQRKEAGTWASRARDLAGLRGGAGRGVGLSSSLRGAGPEWLGRGAVGPRKRKKACLGWVSCVGFGLGLLFLFSFAISNPYFLLLIQTNSN